MNAQSILWFVIGMVALFSGLRILYQRYIAQETRAIQSRGSYTLFGFFMLICSAGAFLAGVITL